MVPVDYHNHPEEFRRNVVAQVPNLKQFAPIKMDTKSETGVKCSGKIIFRVPFFRLIFIDVSYNAVTAGSQKP